MTEKENKNSNGVSRREFLKDAGLLVGGTAIGSTVLLAACGDGDGTTVTKTVTEPGGTTTITSTGTGGIETTTVTERKFVCPYDNIEFDTLDELKAHIEAEHPGAAIGEFTELDINGTKYNVQVDNNWTLQRTLRYKLGLIGSSKDWCNQGACGACSVIMDGRLVLSCTLLTKDCVGKKIETIEGIAAAKHPVLQAYMDVEAIQCGYCIPGFIVAAKALLDKNPNPTAQEAAEALSGNLCRCSTTPRQVTAVLKAAEYLQGGN